MIRESSTLSPSSLHMKFHLPVGARFVDKTSDQTVSPNTGHPTWPPLNLVFLVSFFHMYRFALHRLISTNKKGEYTWTYVNILHEVFNVLRQQLEQLLSLESSIIGADPPFYN